ncbi:MAG: PD40 domain-containing protein, partial [Proteobacteria bacterium]|nr:PD40 domain-containing protein [Pseudomonadota bacterium]
SIPVFSGGNPIWSPDGSRIAFKADSAIWVLEIETGTFARFFREEQKYPIPSCWARDGKSILILLREPPSNRSKILRVFLTGELREVLSPVEGKAYRYAEESPDGSLIAFAWCEGRNCDLWVAPSGGGNAVQLTKHPSYDDSPIWSPDGTRIAFTSARTGRMDIYVMDIDLADLRKELKTLNK